jgi:DNA-binding NarL/FixJ family response regulator
MAQSILVVDDHPLCTAALTMAAHAVDPATIVEIAATLAEAEARVRARRPDLILLDLMLPDVQGFTGLALMRALCPDVPVAIVSSRDEDGTVRKARGLGAGGFISKTSPIDRMIAALRLLLAGGQWFPDASLADGVASEDAAAAERIGSLSVAQLRVLRAIADGAGNKQIAGDLDLAIPTIKSHLAAIFRKLDVSNRTQAVLALRALDAEATA